MTQDTTPPPREASSESPPAFDAVALVYRIDQAVGMRRLRHATIMGAPTPETSAVYFALDRIGVFHIRRHSPGDGPLGTVLYGAEAIVITSGHSSWAGLKREDMARVHPACILADPLGAAPPDLQLLFADRYIR